MSGKIHDGERVRVLLAKRGMSVTEFAGRMELARSTVTGLLQRESWTTDKLLAASKVLESNLFEDYLGKTGRQAGILLLNGENGPEAFGLERLEEWDWHDLYLGFFHLEP